MAQKIEWSLYTWSYEIRHKGLSFHRALVKKQHNPGLQGNDSTPGSSHPLSDPRKKTKQGPWVTSSHGEWSWQYGSNMTDQELGYSFGEKVTCQTHQTQSSPTLLDSTPEETENLPPVILGKKQKNLGGQQPWHFKRKMKCDQQGSQMVSKSETWFLEHWKEENDKHLPWEKFHLLNLTFWTPTKLITE